MPIIKFNQAAVTTGFFDTVNDAAPWSIQTPPTGIINRFQGAVGTIMDVDTPSASVMSSLSTFTFYGGYWQYVKFKDSTNAVKGGLVFWDTNANSGNSKYTVTTVASATNITQVAGIMYNASITATNYGWIQIGGLASVKSLASVTSTVIGAVAIVDSTPTNTFNAIAVGSVTIAQYVYKIGTTYQAAANASVTLVWLQPGGALAWNE
jgi:hypothetical protein